jgi:hypothetical protein
MKWDYLVESVYDDFSLVPESIPPNRLMDAHELLVYTDHVIAVMSGKPLDPSALSGWTFQRYLHVRGQEGWEMVQATRLLQGAGVRGVPDLAYWRVIFKRPRA